MVLSELHSSLRLMRGYWPVMVAILFSVYALTTEQSTWAASVPVSANQTVPPFDFHLNLPQIVHAPALEPLIFADGFETGDFSTWSASKGNEEALSVSPAAALVGSQGLQVVINVTTTVFLTDDEPSAEPLYSARFSFDPNSIAMVSGAHHFIFYGFRGTSEEVLRLQFRFFNGDYQLRAALLDDSANWNNSNWFTISDAAHTLEVNWQAATAVAANDGSLAFWIDDVQMASLTGVDNDMQQIDRIRLGAVAGIDTSTRGTYFFDAFESRRQAFIGPAAQRAQASSRH